MASAPDDPKIVTGRVDHQGRLTAADPPLAKLQFEAGSSIGARLALPQIAAVVRLTRELGVPLSRPVTAAGAHHDFDLWVRATIEGDEIALEIEGWRPRPAAAPRLDLVLAPDDDATVARDPATGEWATDAELKLTALAPDLAERLNIGPSEAMGQPLTRYLKLEEDSDGTLPLLAGLAARAPFGGQHAIPRNGEGVSLLLSGEVLRDETGRFAGFAGRALPPAPLLMIVGDQSPPADAMLADLDRALRSPLDRIIAAADKIVERSDGPLRSDYASYATDIAAAGRHLMSVIRTMSQGAVSSSHSVNLRNCLREAVAITTAAAEARNVRIDVNSSPETLVQAEERGVVQILVNVLGNAIRHSPRDAVISIAISSDQHRARIAIADAGPGIALADQQRIFERFERVVDEPGGTGLGLAISRRLARSMGGDVTLISAPGEGARFTLELPTA